MGILKKRRASGDIAHRNETAGPLEILVSITLRVGVAASAALIILGLVLLAFHPAGGRDMSIDDAVRFPRGFAEIFSGAFALDPLAVVSLGLLVLILTPVARVAIALGAFAAEKDWKYAAFSGIVLAILVASFALGVAGA
jgi:uncharacterized membrane protein